MKFTKALTITLLSASVSASVFKSTIVDSWDTNDLKEYLKDNSISFDEKKATVEQLKELSRKQYELAHRPPQERSWYHPLSLKQKVLNLYPGAVVDDGTGSSISSSIPDLSSSSSSSSSSYIDYDNVKDWIFSTWSTKELQKLLKKAGVKYDTSATKSSDLSKVAQDHYDEIAKYFKASGKYPGEWLYSNWDKKDLKKWLDDYGVDYKSLRDSREDLVKKVRENAYRASKYSQEEKDGLLESLDLANQSLFDKAGTVKDDVFASWSTSQLYKWLKSHQVDLDEKVKTNKDELLALASTYRDNLKSDIDYWSHHASKKASPILEKGSKKADNVINDTFFVGIESWSRDRLKAFLQSRDVAIPLFATKYELINLVKENKYKPIKNFDSDWFFEGWSKENVQKWVQEQSDAASQGSKDLWGKANELYRYFAQSVGHYVNAASDAASETGEKISKLATGEPKSSKDAFFDYWSDVELKKYLGTFGIYNTKNTKRDDLIAQAKKNTLWFVGGASDEASGYYESGKLSTVNTYNSLVVWFKNWYNRLYFALFGKV